MTNILKLINKLHFVSSKFHMFHWNVSGSNFITYHKHLEKCYKELLEHKDQLAEYLRLTNQNQQVLIDFNEVANLSKNFKMPHNTQAMLEDALQEYKSLLESYEEIISSGSNDIVLEAIASDSILQIQKNVYFLQSILN